MNALKFLVVFYPNLFIISNGALLYIYNFLFSETDALSMSHNKPLNPLSKQKNKSTLSKRAKEKDIDDFIAPDSEDIDESEEPKPKMKRLKKLRNSSDEEEELVRGKDKNDMSD